MKRFVEGADRGQWTLLPECLDDFIDEINPVRAIDAFVAALDLGVLGFAGVEPAATGRPSYHPSATAPIAEALISIAELNPRAARIACPPTLRSQPGDYLAFGV